MSELNSGPTRDPIQDLENFGTGGIAVNPLDPAAVRRLGDQRRRRQNTMYGAIAAVVVAVAVIPTALIATKDDGKGGAPLTNQTGTPTPTPSPTVIVFPDGGVVIKAPEDTDQLVGTSDAFKTFIKTVWQKDHDAGCKTAEIDVTKYSPAGFGAGGGGGCGGYQAIWGLKAGTWIEALGTQDEWVCSDLARYDVPDGFAGDCYVPDPAPAVVTFPGNGQDVNQESDAAKLQGTTDDFKEFVIAEVARLQADAAKNAIDYPSDCPDPSAAGVTVKRFAQAGYASGSVFLCPSGYDAIWKKVGGTWKQVSATQEQWACSELDKYDIPRSFVTGGCYYADPFGPDSVAGFSIGMTPAQVQAAGATIEGDPAGDCAMATKPGVIASKDAPLVEVAMTAGKVIAIFAGKGVSTPEGISLGSGEDAVKAAYPNGHRDGVNGYWHVPINAGSEYEIGIGQDKRVSELLIQTTGTQRCYG